MTNLPIKRATFPASCRSLVCVCVYGKTQPLAILRPSEDCESDHGLNGLVGYSRGLITDKRGKYFNLGIDKMHLPYVRESWWINCDLWIVPHAVGVFCSRQRQIVCVRIQDWPRRKHFSWALTSHRRVWPAIPAGIPGSRTNRSSSDSENTWSPMRRALWELAWRSAGSQLRCCSPRGMHQSLSSAAAAKRAACEQSHFLVKVCRSVFYQASHCWWIFP